MGRGRGGAPGYCHTRGDAVSADEDDGPGVRIARARRRIGLAHEVLMTDEMVLEDTTLQEHLILLQDKIEAKARTAA